MKRFALVLALPLMAAVGTGCGGGSQTSNPNPTSTVFVTGEDAPVSSVAAFNITINSVTLNNAISRPLRLRSVPRLEG
jgi:hypothetical protein